MLAFASALLAHSDRVNAFLVSIAHTPLGPVADTARQNVTLSLSGLLDWLDANFSSDDERAFVTPPHDIELLARINWESEQPRLLDEQTVLNLEDVPGDVVEALMNPPEALLQCAACRRLCVRDHFVWKERQLCAWDYHRAVFGRRGAWRSGVIEERHFETVPAPAYIAPQLVEEEGGEVILAVANVDGGLAQQTVNTLIGAQPDRSYIAVRTPEGYSLVRER